MESKKRKFIRELLIKHKTRSDSAVYVVEGPKMASEVPKDKVEEIFVTDGFLKSSSFGYCRDIINEKGSTLVSDSEMSYISDTVTPQGILMTVRMDLLSDFGSFVEAERHYARENALGKPLILILECVQDPGNLGTILRSAEASGVTGIVADSGCADRYSPKTIRSTMGAIFRIPYYRTTNLLKAVKDLSKGLDTEVGAIHIFASVPRKVKSYTDVDFTQGCAIMIGNESKGLSHEILELSGDRISIPMSGRAESLNVAVAASVIGFEAKRQRDR